VSLQPNDNSIPFELDQGYAIQLIKSVFGFNFVLVTRAPRFKVIKNRLILKKCTQEVEIKSIMILAGPGMSKTLI
jgi:hypothetical protein